MLRQTYPDRFTVTSPELVIPIASGDYPHVIANKIPHTNGVAPVLMFGSTFRDMNIYPNMVAMPMPPPEHMGCFVHWVQNIGNGHVCKQWMPGTPDASSNGGGTLVFGEEYGLEYDDLIVSKKIAVCLLLCVTIYMHISFWFCTTIYYSNKIDICAHNHKNAHNISLNLYGEVLTLDTS